MAAVTQIAFIVAAFAVSTALVPLFEQRARRKNRLDIPNERSSHKVPTPRNGGIGIVLGSLVALGASTALTPGQWDLRMLLFVGLLLAGALLGFADDRFNLNTGLRMLLYLMCAAGTSLLGAQTAEIALPGLAGVSIGAAGGLVFSSLFVAWYTNLFNFMDGIDGIAAGAALVIHTSLGYLFAVNGEPAIGLIAFALAAATAGFLIYNAPPARVFMGDGGSVFLGLGAGALSLLAVNHGFISIVAVVFLMLPFVFDATFTLARRAMKREKFWSAHRTHIYQQLCDLGLTHGRISLGYTLLAAALAAVGLHYDAMPNWLQGAVGWSILTAMMLVAVLVVRQNNGYKHHSPDKTD